jgi:NADH:ubiquinone oxidoreductase subunit F (NADH-binding)
MGLESTAGLVRLVRGLLRVVAQESCGKCPPCRVGSQVLANGFEDLVGGDGDPGLLTRVARHVEATADCCLGRSAARLVLGACRELCPAPEDVPGEASKA